eukprot:1151471-Pelagomonas_calceolata.AAC.2
MMSNVYAMLVRRLPIEEEACLPQSNAGMAVLPINVDVQELQHAEFVCHRCAGIMPICRPAFAVQSLPMQ